jgi:hypothetical protein
MASGFPFWMRHLVSVELADVPGFLPRRGRPPAGLDHIFWNVV